MLKTNAPHGAHKYISPEWATATAHGWAKDAFNTSKLCWDIFQFPLTTARFAAELIEESEAFGQWSSGTYKDTRIKGGYEPVPTQDIHFHQLGFKETWTEALRRFVGPVAEHHWKGYTLRNKQNLDFIVKYSTCPTCQPSLRPHFDSSTFSLNIALNQGGVDFTGGGTHFESQNCTVLNNPVGWALIHPGRLTHHHEVRAVAFVRGCRPAADLPCAVGRRLYPQGLKTLTGTRYILVTFVDQ